MFFFIVHPPMPLAGAVSHRRLADGGKDIFRRIAMGDVLAAPDGS
jgi:hypothetical protein